MEKLEAAFSAEATTSTPPRGATGRRGRRGVGRRGDGGERNAGRSPRRDDGVSSRRVSSRGARGRERRREWRRARHHIARERRVDASSPRFASGRVSLDARTKDGIAAEALASGDARRGERHAWRVARDASRDRSCARGASRRPRGRGGANGGEGRGEDSANALPAWRRHAAAAANARASRARRGSSLARRVCHGDASGRASPRAATRATTRRAARAFRRWRDATARRALDDARRRARVGGGVRPDARRRGGVPRTRRRGGSRGGGGGVVAREGDARRAGVGGAGRVRRRAGGRIFLESPLAWRSLETENDASVPALVASTSLPDPTPPVFLPDVDPDAYRPVDDGAPPTAGDVVVIFAGASESMVAATLRLETCGADDPDPRGTAWTLEPTARWTTLGPGEAAGAAAATEPGDVRACPRRRRRRRRRPRRARGGVVGGARLRGTRRRGRDATTRTSSSAASARRVSPDADRMARPRAWARTRGRPRRAPRWRKGVGLLPTAPFLAGRPRRSHATVSPRPRPRPAPRRVPVRVPRGRVRLGSYRSGDPRLAEIETISARTRARDAERRALRRRRPGAETRRRAGDARPRPAPRASCTSVAPRRRALAEPLAVLDIADMTWTRLDARLADARAHRAGGRSDDGGAAGGSARAEMSALGAFVRGTPTREPREPETSRAPPAEVAPRGDGGGFDARVGARGESPSPSRPPRVPPRMALARRSRVAGDDEAAKTRDARRVRRRAPPPARPRDASARRRRTGSLQMCGGASGTTATRRWRARTSRRDVEAGRLVSRDAPPSCRRRVRSRRARGPRETRGRGTRLPLGDETRLVRAAAAALKDEADAVARAEEATSARRKPRDKYLRAKRRAEDAEAKKEEALANAESAAARSDVAWVKKIEAHARRRDARRGRRARRGGGGTRERGTRATRRRRRRRAL